MTNTSPAPAAAAVSRCYPSGKQASRATESEQSVEADRTTACGPFARKAFTATEERLRRSYKPMFGDSRVIVDFPCDPVDEVSEIVLELGEQRTGRLALLRVTRAPEGGEYRVFSVEIRAPEEPPQAYDYRTAERFELRTVKLELAAAALNLEYVRIPLMATINEILFSDHLPSVAGFTGPNIHRLVRVEGKDRQQRFPRVHFQRSYTGEAQSTAQKDYLPLDLAAVPLLALVPAAATGTTITEEHQRLLLARLSASLHAAPDWLRELFLVLAVRVGGADMIPELVEVARGGSEGQRVLAVSALASITGWDARFDAQGNPRPVSAVAADYERECDVTTPLPRTSP